MFYKLVNGEKLELTQDEAIDFVLDDTVDLANHEVYDPATRRSFVILESKATGIVYLMRRNG